MAEKDVGEKTLIAFNDVFADIFNGLIFYGDQVVTADSLEEVSPVSQYCVVLWRKAVEISEEFGGLF